MSAVKESASVVVVGGGVAGLSSAWHLSELGLRDVVLLEADEWFAGHSSARNAAIHMALEESLASIVLAQRSREMVDQYLGTGWIDACGVVYFAEDAEALDEPRFWARQAGVFHESWSSERLLSRVKLLDRGPEYSALALPLSGVMDIHALTQLMIDRARRAGATLHSSKPVEQIEVTDGKVRGCVLRDGTRIATERVVIACGAWAAELGERSQCPLPLTPLKRHLVQLTGDNLHAPRMPAIWRVDDPVYLRPESGGILASPCDETPNRPELPTPDVAQLERLSPKLQRLSTRFARAGVQRSWACLRTMAPDRQSVVGADPRVTGLYWHAALGGWGMTIAPAAGEALAHAVIERHHPLHAALSPARLL